MLNTLYARLAVGLFVLLLAVGLVYSLLNLYALNAYTASINQAVNRDLARNLVVDRDLVSAGQIDQGALQELFSLYMSINPSIEIYLLDPQGRILSYSADPARIKRKRVALEPIERLLADRDAYPVLGDDPRSHDRRKVFSVTPIPSAEQLDAYLYVVLRGEEYDTAELMAWREHWIGMSAWTVSISLGFGLLAGLGVFHWLTRRLRLLTRLVEQFAAGDMRRQAELNWAAARPAVRDEIDYLGLSFEQMARRITSQVDELQAQDALRRKLVAQVSHDLRTPLAAIQGYVETLRLKHASLDPEQQRQFLDIALSECRRLGRLVDELFELAALEASENRPEPEAFAVAELLHDVAQKHLPNAASRKVGIRVEAGADLPAAFADLGMVERVLDNLIRNAVEFSPEGEMVVLGLARSDGFIELKVSDAGPGIAAAERADIFEPFYRGRTKDSERHAGLGLAIARRLIELQGGEIEVCSRPSPGAVFVVRIPLAGTLAAAR